eukprot:m51a1_g7916 hypothetical protein (601) ;mRNA; r:210945-213298
MLARKENDPRQPSTATHAPAAAPKQRPRNPQGELLGYDPALVLVAGGSGGAAELQFEMVRAAAYARPRARRNSRGEALGYDRDALGAPGAAECQFEELRARSGKYSRWAQEEARRRTGPTPRRPRSRAAACATPTVTINTRLAREDIDQMFGSPLPPLDGVCRKTDASVSGSVAVYEDDDEGDDEDEPLQLIEQQQQAPQGGFQIYEDAAAAAAADTGAPSSSATATATTAGVGGQPQPQRRPSSSTPAVVQPFSHEHQAGLLARVAGELAGLRSLVRHPEEDAPRFSACDRGTVELGGEVIVTTGRAGEGGFAQIIAAHPKGNAEVKLALKVQSPPCLWEFYVARAVQSRVGPREGWRFVDFREAHVYRGASVLVMPLGPQGTLQGAVNACLRAGRAMEEALALYYAAEILRALDALHRAGFVHADVKPDNFLLRNEWAELDQQLPEWRRGAGVEGRGLVLIDFGHCIDRTLYPEGTMFTGECHSQTFSCAEMREGRPWARQIDMHGAAVTLHCMLHGSWMQAVRRDDGRWAPSEPLKRVWQTQVWQRLFDELLNGGEGTDLGALADLVEGCLEATRKGAKVRSLLVRQDVSLYSCENS